MSRKTKPQDKGRSPQYPGECDRPELQKQQKQLTNYIMPSVYLLHFEQPISDRHTAQHYLGYTQKLSDRIEQHRRGQGSRLCAVAVERGIGFEVARTWSKGTRRLERQLKRRKSAPRLCPICQAKHQAKQDAKNAKNAKNAKRRRD